MMIIRIRGLQAAILLVSLMVMGGTQAADAKLKKTGKPVKQYSIKISNKKIKHPCARKSAAQLNRRAKPFLKSIQTHAKRYGVDSDLVKSVITIESCYRQKARSPKGAQGLMQLIPATADRFGISDPYDSHQNIKGGARYLSWLSKRFKGDLTKVLAAYNAGEGKVDRYNGIPPYRETRHYVHDVLAVYNKLKANQPGTQFKATQLVKRRKSTISEQDRLLVQRQKQMLAAKRAQQVNVLKQQRARLQRQQQQNKQLAAMTPRQRQHYLRQQQQRELQVRRQLLQQQARLRTQQQKLQAQLKRRQHLAGNGLVEVIGQPIKPIYAKVPVAKPQRAKPQSNIVIGKPPISEAAAQQAERQKLAQQRARQPVLRKAQAKVAAPSQQQGGRVRSVFSAPFKPGRGGWQANKALAPHLYKQ